MIKKFAHILRFLALVFFLFLAVTMCFVFNKVLDQQISNSTSNTLNEVQEIYGDKEATTEE